VVEVHEVWVTVDVGFAVNPRGIEAQVEGSICHGLSAALYGEIKVENGAAITDDFDTYPMLRIADTPEIETVIINSGSPMSGMESRPFLLLRPHSATHSSRRRANAFASCPFPCHRLPKRVTRPTA
jgi:hypothetical protein